MAPAIEIRVPRRRHFGLIAAAVVTVAAVAAAAPAPALAPVAGFAGDAGFDIWLTGPGQYTGYGTTAAMEEASSSATEVMVWLNSPGTDRNEYHSLGYRVIDGRSWEVLYTLAHRWRYVVFAAPLATSKTVTITAHNIKPASSGTKIPRAARRLRDTR